MKQIEKYISPFVESQFPSFYHEEGETFIAFVKAYYEWLESSNNVLYHTRRLPDYRDIDTTLDEYLIYFKEKYLKNIQFAPIATNKKQLIKNSLSLYRSKGTERSIDLFFKLVYGTNAEVRYPADNILRASDGVWSAPEYIEVTNSKYNINYIGKQIIGSVSSAKAFVEKFIKRKVKTGSVNILYISNRQGEFVKGEAIGILQNTVPQFDPNKNSNVIGSINEYQIIERGKNFKIGDVLDFKSNLRGLGGSARVSGIQKSSASIDFTLNDGGYGYSLGAEPIISEKILNLTDVQSTTTENYFKIFETVIQPTVELTYNGLSAPIADGSLIYRYDDNDSLVSTGKIISSDVINSVAGVFKVSIIGGSFSNGTYYNTANAKTFNVSNLNVKVVQAKVVGRSPNTSIKVGYTGSVPLFNRLSNVEQRSDTDINGTGSITEIITNEDEEYLILKLANSQGLYTVGSNVNIIDDLDVTANVISIDHSIGVYDIKRSNSIVTFTGANNETIKNSSYVYQYNESGLELAKGLVFTGNHIAGSGNLTVFMLKGAINSNRKIYSESNTAEATVESWHDGYIGGDFIVSEYSLIRGSQGNTTGYIPVISSGSGADFEIGSISDTQFVRFNTDIIKSKNIGYINKRRFLLTVDDETDFEEGQIVFQEVNKISFNSNTDINAVSGFITLPTANTRISIGSSLIYSVDVGNTEIDGLSDNSNYYVYFSNSTGIILSYPFNKTVAINTSNYPEFTSSAISETGHYFHYMAAATVESVDVGEIVVQDIYNNFGITDTDVYSNSNLTVYSSDPIIDTAIDNIDEYDINVVEPKLYIDNYIRESGYGFPKKTDGFIENNLQSLLSFDVKEVGSISSLKNERGGIDYSNSPFVLVYEPYIAAKELKDFIFTISNTTNLFLVGESIIQTSISGNTYILKVDGDVYGNVYTEKSTAINSAYEINDLSEFFYYRDIKLSFNPTKDFDDGRQFIKFNNANGNIENGDLFRYYNDSGNTSIFANNELYYVIAANTTGVAAISVSPNGLNVEFTTTNTVSFNSLTSVNSDIDFISIVNADTTFTNDDAVVYYVSDGVTPLTGLSNNQIYYVVHANSTGLALSENISGSNVDITSSLSDNDSHYLKYYNPDETGHYFQVLKNKFENNSKIIYNTNHGITPITGLTNNYTYYVVGANSIGFSVSLTKSGEAIDIDKSVSSEDGHYFVTVPGYQLSDSVYSNIIRTFDPTQDIDSNFITIPNNTFVNGDLIEYYVDGGITPIITEGDYYAVQANSSGIKLSTTLNGTPETLPTGPDYFGHNLKSVCSGVIDLIFKIDSNLFVRISNTINTPATGVVLFSESSPWVDSFVLSTERVILNTDTRGIVKAGSDETTLYIKRLSIDNNFLIGAKILGELSGSTANIISIVEDSSIELPLGLNADIIANSAISVGRLDMVQILDSGFGHSNGETITVTTEDGNEATLKIITGGTGKSRGQYTSTKGFLSADMYLHDGDYYQEYSYEIFSKLSVDRYAEMFKTVMHTAGTKFFGSVVNVEEDDINVSVDSHLVEEEYQFNANLNISSNYIMIPTQLANDDLIEYRVATGNTSLFTPNNYYIVDANSTAFKLSLTTNGSPINITASSNDEDGHYIIFTKET